MQNRPTQQLPTADDVCGQLHARHRRQQRVAHPLKLLPAVLAVHALQHSVAAALDLQLQSSGGTRGEVVLAHRRQLEAPSAKQSCEACSAVNTCKPCLGRGLQ